MRPSKLGKRRKNMKMDNVAQVQDPLIVAGLDLPDLPAQELLEIWKAGGGEEPLRDHLQDLEESTVLTEEVLMAVVQ